MPSKTPGAPASASKLRKNRPIEMIARGLLIEQGHLLLCRAVQARYRYLPGGHIEFGERAGVALGREFVEECGLIVETGPLALTMEHAFGQGPARRHELLLVFHVERPRAARATGGLPRPVMSLEPTIAFDWWPLEKLGSAKLRPGPMVAWLKSLAGASLKRPPSPWLSPRVWSES